MSRALPNPSPQRVPVFASQSPLRDLVFWEKVNLELQVNRDMTYGTPHWDSVNFPNHKLVHVRTLDNGGVWYQFYYAAARASQDEYNWEFQNGDTLVRTYFVPRDQYPGVAEPPVPLEDVLYALPVLTADTAFPAYVFVGESPMRADEVLDGLFIAVKRIFTKQFLVSYRFDDEIERHVKVTKQPILKESYVPDPQDPMVPGVVVEIVAENNWIDFKVTSEVLWKTEDFTGPNLIASLPEIPADLNYNFPRRLNKIGVIWCTAYAGHASAVPAYDEAFYFNYFMTEPLLGPYRGTIVRYLTSNPSVVDIIGSAKPGVRQDSFGIVRTWSSGTKRGNGAKATAIKVEVPASIHSEITLPLFADGLTESTIPPGVVPGGTGAFYPLKLLETPGYADFMALPEVVASVETKRAKYNLYEVQVAKIPMAGIYADYVP